jgi:hypothetical protein
MCFVVPCLLFSSNSSPTIVLFVSLIPLLKLLFLFHNTKFFHFIFLLSLYHLFLSSNFENFEHGIPQLEHPKVAIAHNITWRPKVAKANNDIWRPKVEKSNNVIVNVFYTFPFSSIFVLLILQNIIINQLFIWISPLH